MELRMRRVDWLVGLGALCAVSGGAAALVALGGCSVDLGDCSKYGHVGCPGYTSTTTNSSSSGTMSSSSSSGVMPSCVGDPTTDAMLVSDIGGVFVSATAAAGGTGSKESPFKDVSDAIVAAQTGGKYIFVCAETYT